ncbi:MAG: CDP-alcohol phosphatidyltransferase family protein [Leptospira sp.]|jgi:CDP-diacylglycerol--serine O-phosphatidyltransferase|nr:CDP-alcohol phosphatidyltransferase family protein [Leptospira sp.]
MKINLTWIPNTLTLGNLTLGFVSMLLVSEVTPATANAHEMFTMAGVFIILAALFDGFDGMAARALNATSELGADLDSLADLTTFGIAPGFLSYRMFFSDLKLDIFGKPEFLPLGMFVAALYPICAAYRLARFNVAHDPKSFVGLPSPVAGVVVGIFPLVFQVSQVPRIVALVFFVLTALLMVSTLRYSKPQVAIRGLFSWKKIGVTVFGLCLVLLAIGFYRWPYVLYAAVGFYVFSGIVAFVIHTIQELRV